MLMSFSSHSPWLAQLNRKRPIQPLQKNMIAGTVVIGGGISGIVTAYFLLKYTKKKVLLLEAAKVAHGATGHNAGQLASYFERPFSSIVKEFGVDMATKGQQALEESWNILDAIYADTKLTVPCQQFTGYAGCRSFLEVVFHLKDIFYQRKGGVHRELMFISDTASFLNRIPKKYRSCYSLVPHHTILSLLETKNTAYVATLAKRKGCLNSALFSEELAQYLLRTYPDRFTLAEHSPVDIILLQDKKAILTVGAYRVTAKHVIMCTNGFEKITIVNMATGGDIDAKFHHLIRGSVGYMAGYLETLDKAPTAISYLPGLEEGADDALETDPYYYLTRRPFEDEKNVQHNLVCVGGPESLMDDTNHYKREHPYPKEAQHMIDKFIRKNYVHAPKKKISYKFRWHGLMGFTPNGLRCVGFEPCNRVLLYNLGCNGVGILSALYGSKRIVTLLQGKKVAPSIFDPQDMPSVTSRKKKRAHPIQKKQLYKKIR